MRAETFVIAQHSSQGRLILAVCDGDVYGRRLEERDAVLDLSSQFYAGEEKDAAAVEKLMRKAYAIHAVGEKAVAVAVKLGFANKGDAKMVKGVPHVQVLMLA